MAKPATLPIRHRQHIPGLQNSYSSFCASRFLLGMTESGFIPGGLWALSTWYTRHALLLWEPARPR